jgi:hypothetical protein
VTLEELVIALEQHRRQLAPAVSGLASAALDDTCRELVGVLEESDRELGRLCRRLRRHFGRFEERAGRQEPWM